MPIYEYYCQNCRRKFEKMRPFSSSQEKAECPHCQTSSERVLSACYAKTVDSQGSVQSIGGDSCSSCAGGNCSSCHN